MKQQSYRTGLIVLAVLGFFAYFFVNAWSAATGEVDNDMRPDISKERVEEAALNFLLNRNITDAQEPLVTLQTHKSFNGYLLKNNFYHEYSTHYKETFPIDYFQVELVLPSNDERIWIDVHMKNADIIGWRHMQTAKTAPTEGDITAAKSQIASMGYNPDLYTITSKSNKLIFTNPKQQIGESVFEIHVDVQDGLVTSFHPLFSIPVSYTEWLQEQDASTGIMSLVNLGFSLLMLITAIVLSVLYRNAITFSRGLFLTFVFAVTSCIHNFNMYPAFKTMFVGEAEVEWMTLFTLILQTLFTLATAALVYLAIVSGDGLWRLEGRQVWARWKEPSYGDHVIQAMGYGYLFCFMILGFQRILFFIGEQYFDVWQVNDPLFSTYNLAAPLLFPLLAWAAAISEEAIYRLFGIILFKKLVRNTFLAVLLPSIIWALGHTQYPIYPAYTRFIEVTLLGLIFGYIFLKHGFITAIFTHASVNSFMMGLSMLYIPGGPAAALTGMAYIASPAIVAYLIYLLHPKFKRGSPPLFRSGDPEVLK
jgi:hypothetical protein